MHEVVASHFSFAVNADGTQFLTPPQPRHFARNKAFDLLLDANDPATMDTADAPDLTAGGLHRSIHGRCPHARGVMHVHSIHATIPAWLEDCTLPPLAGAMWSMKSFAASPSKRKANAAPACWASPRPKP